MADILFLLAGIVLLFTKKVRISKKRTLSGRPVKILATLYILPFTVGFIGGLIFSTSQTALLSISWISISFTIIAVLITLYFILFHKEK
jgi:hypothetical protein